MTAANNKQRQTQWFIVHGRLNSCSNVTLTPVLITNMANLAKSTCCALLVLFSYLMKTIDLPNKFHASVNPVCFSLRLVSPVPALQHHHLVLSSAFLFSSSIAARQRYRFL
jgi:hypothetical protein